MKALEARVTALSSSPQSSPKSAPPPTTAESVGSGHRADSSASISFNTAVGGSLMPTDQAGRQLSSLAAVSGQNNGAVHRIDLSAAAAPKKAGGGAVADRAAAPSRAVPSTDPQGRAGGNVSSVPDLMTFSPAVGIRPTGLHQQQGAMPLHPIGLLQQTQQTAPDASGSLNNAHVPASKQQHVPRLANSSQALVSGQQQGLTGAAQAPDMHSLSLQQPKQAASAQQPASALHSDPSHPAGTAVKTSNALHSHAEHSPLLPGSRTASPLPGGSFYDNAVFGSPTPTPSPQRDGLGLEHSLLSPGSSPRPQQHPLNMRASKPAGVFSFSRCRFPRTCLAIFTAFPPMLVWGINHFALLPCNMMISAHHKCT